MFIQSNVDLRYVPSLSKLFWFWVDCWCKSELILISFVFSEEKSLFVSIRIIEKVNNCFSELIVIELSIKFVHLFKHRFQENKCVLTQILNPNSVWWNNTIFIRIQQLKDSVDSFLNEVFIMQISWCFDSGHIQLVFGFILIERLKIRMTCWICQLILTFILLKLFLFLLYSKLTLFVKLLPNWNVLFVISWILSSQRLVKWWSTHLRLESEFIIFVLSLLYFLFQLNRFFQTVIKRLFYLLNTFWVKFWFE